MSKLNKITKRRVSESDIQLFSVVRNASERLPYWLEYYRDLGVQQFYIVDNASNDMTSAVLRNQPDVIAFYCDDSFLKKQLWIDKLMDEYGKNKWCIIADIDEYLVLPSYMSGLRQLTEICEKNNHDAVLGRLINMYSDRAIIITSLGLNANPFVMMPYFDHPAKSVDVNHRVFNIMPDLAKVPLVNWSTDKAMSLGHHSVNQADYAAIQLPIAHFPFAHDFVYAIGENNHTDRGRYQRYRDMMISNQFLTLYDEQVSIEYEGPDQLDAMAFLLENEKEIAA